MIWLGLGHGNHIHTPSLRPALALRGSNFPRRPTVMPVRPSSPLGIIGLLSDVIIAGGAGVGTDLTAQ